MLSSCLGLSLSRQYSVGFEMVTVSTVVETGPAGVPKKNSGDYRYRIHRRSAHRGVQGQYIVLSSR